MKIEREVFECLYVRWILAARNGKKLSFRLLRPNLPQLGLFHPYFVCKYSFREISMIKMVILDQSKPISLILKIKFLNCTFLIHKNGNKTSIQPILKSNSTSFMFNNIFCEMNIKKVIHCWGNGGTVLISSWERISVFTWISRYITWISRYITWISKQYPHFYAFYWFLMCWFLLLIHFSIIQLLSWKVTFSRHSKDYSTQSFGPTRMGLGSFWRVSEYLKMSRQTYSVVILFKINS